MNLTYQIHQISQDSFFSKGLSNILPFIEIDAAHPPASLLQVIAHIESIEGWWELFLYINTNHNISIILYHRKEQSLICCCASTWSTSLHGQPLWVSSTWQGRCSGEQEDLMIQRNLTAWFSRPNGKLVTYGPYAQDGVLTPESNQQVDIKHWSPLWSISVWSESSLARRIVGNPRHQGTKRGCSGSRPQPGPGW